MWPMWWCSGISNDVKDGKNRIIKAKRLVLDHTALLALEMLGLLDHVLSGPWTVVLPTALIQDIIEDALTGMSSGAKRVWHAICKGRSVTVDAPTGDATRKLLGDMWHHFDRGTQMTVRLGAHESCVSVFGDQRLIDLCRDHNILAVSAMSLIVALRDKHIIDLARYSAAVVDLHRRHHCFVPVSGNDLLHAWNADGATAGSATSALFWPEIGRWVSAHSFLRAYAPFVAKILRDCTCDVTTKATIIEWFVRILDTRFSEIAQCLVMPDWFGNPNSEDAPKECLAILEAIAQTKALCHAVGTAEEESTYGRAVFRAMSGYIICTEFSDAIRARTEQLIAQPSSK